MKILVPVKRVVDYNVKVRAKADGSGVETAGVKMSMNPFDEIAVEEAVRLKEKGIATEIIIVSIGPDTVQETIRAALALGGDRGIHIATDTVRDSFAAAQLLAAVARQETPSLIITGKQAIDDDANQTGQMLAGLLGWGQATFASKIEVKDGAVQVTREVDAGFMTVALPLPAVITTDLRLNEPRYAALPNIMKARSKPLAKKTPEELGVTIAARQKTLKVEEPPKRKGGVKVKTVDELVDKLKNEAKVI